MSFGDSGGARVTHEFAGPVPAHGTSAAAHSNRDGGAPGDAPGLAGNAARGHQRHVAHPTRPAFAVHGNGQDATPAQLAPLAFAGHAHFTAMQVRAGRVRGLDLHLARLRGASLAMFRQALPDEQVRAYLRTALATGPADVSAVVTVYSTAGEFVAVDGVPEALVRTGPASAGPVGPLRLAAFEHERFLPGIKHVGEVAKTYLLRQAVALGFDDVAFIDRRGRLSEGSIWNLAFWDGDAVVWPVADMLGGTTMAIVRRQLDRLGIAQRDAVITLADLPAMAGAVVMNSWTPGIAVHQIGPAALPDAPAFMALLHRAYQDEPPTLV